MKKLKTPNTLANPSNFDRVEKLPEVDNIIADLKSVMEEKEAIKEYKELTKQWAENDTLYIIPAWTKFKLIKDWKETEIEVSKDSINWESTFLAYLEGKKIPANASTQVLWKYFEISFDKLKNELQKNGKIKLIKRFFQELENKRKWKTEIVER